MATFFNIFNFVFLGFFTTLGWLFSTILSILLIVTIPYTRSCWEITKMSLVPFGNEAIHVKYFQETNSVANGLGVGLNVIWLVFCGWWLALLHILTGIGQLITIIGIPCGLANFKLAGIALFPVGLRLVSTKTATVARMEYAKNNFANRKH